MPKNIVICCDGTANKISGDHTNVLKLWSALVREQERQVVYYDPGVGTLGRPIAMTRWGRTLNRVVDAAVGRGVGDTVIRAYAFLMQHYQDGDAVYLFGFSRGAYTVRALAGLVHMFGLATVGDENLLPYLWQMYSNEDGTEGPAGERFRIGRWFEQFTRTIPIHFVGVWDTVSSRGWFFVLDSLPHTATNPSVVHIRHAVSLDERRAAFRQNLFQHASTGQDFKEVWFAGVHCDVGGGYRENESGLAKLALEWMFREAEAQGLLVEQSAKAALLGNDLHYARPDPIARSHSSLTWGWWLMEFLPRRRWFRADSRYHWRMNLFRRRVVPPGAVLHSSVGTRWSRVSRYRPAASPTDHPVEP